MTILFILGFWQQETPIPPLPTTNYRVRVSTVSRVVAEVAQAIWDLLVDEQMRPPTNAAWRKIAEGFGRSGNSQIV